MKFIADKVLEKIKKTTKSKEKRIKWWKPLSLKREASSVKAVDQLMDNSRLELSFFVMCGLSGILATLGLLIDDQSVLIAAMILAPLLNPILALAAGLTIMNPRLIIYALKSLFGGLAFVILVTTLLVKYLALLEYDIDITGPLQKFGQLDHYLFLIAFISGFSGVYSWLKATNASNFVGVAIAVSLVPFVSFFGILIGLERYSEISWYLVTFTVNIFSITLGALLAFIILGFSRHKKEILAQVEKNDAE